MAGQILQRPMPSPAPSPPADEVLSLHEGYLRSLPGRHDA